MKAFQCMLAFSSSLCLDRRWACISPLYLLWLFVWTENLVMLNPINYHIYTTQYQSISWYIWFSEIDNIWNKNLQGQIISDNFVFINRSLFIKAFFLPIMICWFPNYRVTIEWRMWYVRDGWVNDLATTCLVESTGYDGIGTSAASSWAGINTSFLFCLKICNIIYSLETICMS